MQTTPGLYYNVPAADYFALEALNASGAKLLLRSPAHFLVSKRNEREPSAAMRLGTLVHGLVLEPEETVENCAVCPKFDRRTTIGKKAAEEFEASAAGKLVIDEETWSKARRIADNVLAHPVIKRDMNGGAAEATLLWQQHGARCKARVDYLVGSTIFDIKTCQDASPDGFTKQIARYAYHLQAAHYEAGFREVVGWDLGSFVFVAVETEAPYMVRLYTLDERSRQSGRILMQRAALAYHEAMEMMRRGDEARMVEDVVELSVPNWAQIEPYED